MAVVVNERILAQTQQEEEVARATLMIVVVELQKLLPVLSRLLYGKRDKEVRDPSWNIVLERERAKPLAVR